MKINDLNEQIFSTVDTSLEPTLTGTSHCGGATSGQVCFSFDEVLKQKAQGNNCIYVEAEPDINAVNAILASDGYLSLTNKSNSTHSLILALINGTPSLRGVSKEAFLKNFSELDTLTIDGLSGKIFNDRIDMRRPNSKGLEEAIQYLDSKDRMEVYALMVSPDNLGTISRFGIEGVGPMGTEYMFYDAKGERLPNFQRLILTEDDETKAQVFKYQYSDFKKIFEALDGRTLSIRLFDPPLNEFIPSNKGEIAKLAKTLDIDKQRITDFVKKNYETNPMLGYRGCRLGICQPDMYALQTNAMFSAASAAQDNGKDVDLEIIVPLVSYPGELAYVKNEIIQPAASDFSNVPYKTGIMLELPATCILADELAKTADVFSVGSNDLTQTVRGISRDDANRFLGEYCDKNIIQRNPFVTLDSAVTKFMELGIEKGRRANPDLKVSICGAQARDPDSIKTCNQLGIDCLAVMPYSVPQAKLAAIRNG